MAAVCRHGSTCGSKSTAASVLGVPISNTVSHSLPSLKNHPHQLSDKDLTQAPSPAPRQRRRRPCDQRGSAALGVDAERGQGKRGRTGPVAAAACAFGSQSEVSVAESSRSWKRARIHTNRHHADPPRCNIRRSHHRHRPPPGGDHRQCLVDDSERVHRRVVPLGPAGRRVEPHRPSFRHLLPSRVPPGGAGLLRPRLHLLHPGRLRVRGSALHP